MAKGKNKDKKKSELPSKGETSASSSAITEPSTSRQETPAVEKGTTGGVHQKKEQTIICEAPPPAEPKPEPQPSPAPVAVESVEEEFVGLGLGSSKKKRPRKKKEAISAPSTSAPVIAAPVVQAVAVTQPPYVQAAPREAHASVISQPRGWGTHSQGPPQQGPPQPGPSQPGPSQQGLPQQSPPIRGHPQQGPPQQGPPVRGPLQQGPPQQRPPQADPYSQTADGGRGRGRGGGRGRGAAPPSYTQDPRPGPASVPLIAQGDVHTKGGTPPKIPDKIVGRTVSAQEIRLLTNYLPMTFKPLIINRYDVIFTPDRPKKMLPKAFLAAKNKLFPKSLIAFDQVKICYALEPLSHVTQTERLSKTVEIEDINGKLMTFEVSLKGTGAVNLGHIHNHMAQGGSSHFTPTDVIQCIDVILRQGTLESYVKSGRQFFKRPNTPIYLGDGLEMWTGLFQSAIFTSSAFINIDVAHKGFPKAQPLVDALVNDFRLDTKMPVEQQRGRGVDAFMSFIKGLKVMASVGGDESATGLKREFICNDLVKSPRETRFTRTENGKEVTMSVEQYFYQEKRLRLKYPHLNCVWVGPRDKNIFYPMELLTVSYGQVVNKQLNEMQLSTMVREAATPPDIRKRKIEEVISSMNYSNNVYFKKFGLEIGKEFIEVKAKVLKAPVLDVGGGQTILPRRGAWQAQRLFKAENLDSWAFIALDLDPRASNSETIISLLQREGSRLGMRIATPAAVVHNVRITELYSRLMTFANSKIKFVVIVVATRGKDYYHKVKQAAEREVGILTQCIKEFTASRKMNPQTAKNILLKINSKLMGINQALDRSCTPRSLRDEDVMVVGADVTHPSPEQSTVPSIAAVAASFDSKCFMYNIQLSVQTPKKEMIVEFEDMMLEHLQLYKQKNNVLPKKIYVFRDGVSEGQFEQVMRSELVAVHNAYRRLSQVKPEVLFLLVQKRHHTRFFVPQSSNNVEPGTVVDTTIVHPRELDFYMVSHQAIKGTARPTRYHALCNDGGIPHDEVEQLTHFLCHLYACCMRSVSYPTPTYYAHRACLRARSLTYGERYDSHELERNPKRLRVLDRMLSYSRMFFV